ncbi:hypothetical protein ACFLUT_00440 [Chloroflexota bacterium]
MHSHKSWLLPALAVIGAMLLVGGALLYLNPNYVNAATSADAEAVGVVASAPAADTTSCSGSCGDCTSADACTGEGDCDGAGTCSGSGDCDGAGTCSGSGDCDGAGTCSGGGDCDGSGACSGGGDCDGAGDCSGSGDCAGGGQCTDKVVCDRAEASSLVTGCAGGCSR